MGNVVFNQRFEKGSLKELRWMKMVLCIRIFSFFVLNSKQMWWWWWWCDEDKGHWWKKTKNKKRQDIFCAVLFWVKSHMSEIILFSEFWEKVSEFWLNNSKVWDLSQNYFSGFWDCFALRIIRKISEKSQYSDLKLKRWRLNSILRKESEFLL